MSQAGSISTAAGGGNITFNADTGAAATIANSIEIVGDGTVETSASGNTITLSFDASGTSNVPTSVETDSGTVTPSSNTFSIVGAAGISTSGSGTVLTVTGTATDLVTHQADSGTATPVANILNVLGGTGVDTTATGNTVTINATAAVPLSFPTDSGTGTPAASALSILGGTNANTSASGAAITVNVDYSNLTAGSVVFSDGTDLTEDNANLFWDDTNNRLGIGTTTPLDEFHVVGAMHLDHTAAISDDHALEITCDAAGFGDVKGLEIDYITGALQSAVDDEVILINIDETASIAGEVYGLTILSTTEGAAKIVGMKTGIGIDALHQDTGTFIDMDSVLNKTVDVLAALSDGGAGNITMFVADNDTVTIGDAAMFSELEIIIDTGASGAGIAPTFEYSTGVGTWTSFTPTDGTNGFKNTGILAWDTADLTGFAVGTGSEFLIRITRTKNSLSTAPIVDEIQIASIIEYHWDLNGDLDVKSIDIDAAQAYTINNTSVLNATTLGSTVVTSSLTTVGTIGTGVWNGTVVTEPYGGTNQSSFTIGDILYASGTDTLSKLAKGSENEILKMGASNIPTWSAVADNTWTEVTGTSQAMAVGVGYIANNAGLVTLTLPDTAAIGDRVRVAGKGAGLFKIAQNAGDTVHMVASSTTTGAGGSLTATEQYAAIELVCITANTDFVVLSATGNYTIV